MPPLSSKNPEQVGLLARHALPFGLALLCAGTALAESDGSPGEFTGDDVSCAYGVTAEGTSDGTLGVFLPGGDVATWDVHARLRFDEYEFEWTEGPWTGGPGEFVTWLAWVPEEALMVGRQYDYLSDLSVRVRAYDSMGVRTSQFSPGLSRVAFDVYEDPLVLLPQEAAELAPGDAWNELVSPRVFMLPKDDDILPERYTGPSRPDDVGYEGEEE